MVDSPDVQSTISLLAGKLFIELGELQIEDGQERQAVPMMSRKFGLSSAIDHYIIENRKTLDGWRLFVWRAASARTDLASHRWTVILYHMHSQ